jgi:uncharacterized protein
MPRSRKQTVLLVDGYNVIGAWSDLHDDPVSPLDSFHAHSRAELAIARTKLIEALINYSAYEDYETTIVFDAHSRDNPAITEVVTPNLSIHYTDFLQTADSYIERYCAGFRSELKSSVARLVVATSDRAQQLTAVGFGADCITALQLISNIEFAAKRASRQHRPPNRSGGRFLFNSLDPEAQAKLSALRHGKSIEDSG